MTTPTTETPIAIYPVATAATPAAPVVGSPGFAVQQQQVNPQTGRTGVKPEMNPKALQPA